MASITNEWEGFEEDDEEEEDHEEEDEDTEDGFTKEKLNRLLTPGAKP
jgi:hypothetical protein